MNKLDCYVTNYLHATSRSPAQKMYSETNNNTNIQINIEIEHLRVLFFRKICKKAIGTTFM